MNPNALETEIGKSTEVNFKALLESLVNDAGQELHAEKNQATGRYFFARLEANRQRNRACCTRRESTILTTNTK
jgi:hypothetical protein